VGAVSLGLVLALELLLRAAFPQNLAGVSLRGTHLSEGDSALGLRYVPNAVWRFTHPEYVVEYAINASGFRDAKTRPAAKPPGLIRVLLLGDSFTFGQGVDYEQTWPVLAERELERRGLGHVDLIKAAMQGMDTRSELLLLRRLAGQYQVDAVVVGFLINDLYTNAPDSPGSPWGTIRQSVFQDSEGARTFHLLTLARRLVTSSDAGYIALYFAAAGGRDYLRLPLSPAAMWRLGITDTLFRQMAAFCDSVGARLIALSIPQQIQVLYSQHPRPGDRVDVRYYDRHLSGLAERTGFTWVPTLDAFAGADSAAGSEELFYRLDGHLTPAGHAVVADVFLGEVVPMLLAGRPASQGDPPP